MKIIHLTNKKTGSDQWNSYPSYTHMHILYFTGGPTSENGLSLISIWQHKALEIQRKINNCFDPESVFFPLFI